MYFRGMKNLYALLLACGLTASAANATVITSAANGNVTNPFTWDCTCIPVDGDTIVIQHALTLDVDYAFTMGSVIIQAGGSVTGNSGSRILGVSGGTFINYGTLNVGYLAHNGGSFYNYANITVLGSLLIDQAVTLNNDGTFLVGDTAAVNTNATLINTSSFNATDLLSDGTITNTGNISAFNLFTSGTLTHSGTALILQMSLYNIGNATLNGYTEVMGDVLNAENFTVNGYVKTQSLYNGDSISGTATFTNNGTISVLNSLYNSEDMNGSGDYCIADSSLNAGNITGTLDICDQTGGGVDFNFGTIGGSVTNCASGPCTIGIAEQAGTDIVMTPNPSHELITLQFPQAEAGVVEVMDMTGRVVIREDIAGPQMQLNILHLPEGLYTVVVRGASQSYNGRFVKE
jgi:hypothetical protein